MHGVCTGTSADQIDSSDDSAYIKAQKFILTAVGHAGVPMPDADAKAGAARTGECRNTGGDTDGREVIVAMYNSLHLAGVIHQSCRASHLEPRSPSSAS